LDRIFNLSIQVPFDAGEQQQIAGNVIADQGNEFLVTKNLIESM
jgi:hypothetical protein